MYLGLLNAREKELFIGLVQHLVLADGENSDEEQKMILSYCEEMHMPYVKEFTQMAEKEIVEELVQISTMQSKKIISFELLGLALVDGRYDAKEQEMLQEMNERFGIADGYGKECEELIADYIELQKKIEKVVLK